MIGRASALVLVVLAACSNSTNATPDGCQAFVDGWVHYRTRCEFRDDPLLELVRRYEPVGVSDVALLQSRLLTVCQGLTHSPGSGIGQADLSTCARRLESCDGSPCLSLLAGTLQNGAPCWGSYQCANHNCVHATPEAACGTCQASIPAWGACSLPTCAAGTLCQGGYCYPVVTGAAGVSCASTSGPVTECDVGLVCSDGSCQPRRKLGEACIAGQCGIDLTCSGSTCIRFAASPLETTALDDGAACVGSPTDGCKPFASCIDGTCQLPPLACK